MGEAHEPRSGCPINAAIEVFGDRWSLLVLRDIVFGDSNKAAPRSGKSSWTSFATRTSAPDPQRDHRAFASA
jgi:hypothetical protein